LQWIPSVPVERKKRVARDGREVEATELLFRAAGESWNEYLVDDGCLLRLKIVVTEVNRLEGEYDADGQPVYAIKSVNAMRVSAPKHLRRETP
jgi:hypothetical protein